MDAGEGTGALGMESFLLLSKHTMFSEEKVLESLELIENKLSRIFTRCTQFGQMVCGVLMREGPIPQKASDVICSP